MINCMDKLTQACNTVARIIVFASLFAQRVAGFLDTSFKARPFVSLREEKIDVDLIQRGDILQVELLFLI